MSDPVAELRQLLGLDFDVYEELKRGYQRIANQHGNGSLYRVRVHPDNFQKLCAHALYWDRGAAMVHVMARTLVRVESDPEVPLDKFFYGHAY